VTDPFSLAAGWLHETLILPALYAVGGMEWEETAFGWALFACYGAAQVAVTFAICLPLERWRPVERWPDQKAVWVDVLYTLISRVGVLPLVTFVLFYQLQVGMNGWLSDHGWIPPTLERLVPALLGHHLATFFLYAVILDFSEYWRHRMSHRFGWWWALHSLHHAQRQMTFWSDDRNHIIDDLIGFVWFMAVGLLIGIPPMQFPLLVLLLRLLESLSHANARLSFGWLGERLLVSPRFHRSHHGVLATRRPRRRWRPAATSSSSGRGCGAWRAWQAGQVPGALALCARGIDGTAQPASTCGPQRLKAQGYAESISAMLAGFGFGGGMRALEGQL